MMPLVFFMSPGDPRMLATLDAINRPPRDGGLVSDGLVFRYDVDKAPDGLSGHGGYIQHLHVLAGGSADARSCRDPERLDDARLIFEQMLGYANHLGLYAEQIGSAR